MMPNFAGVEKFFTAMFSMSLGKLPAIVTPKPV